MSKGPPKEQYLNVSDIRKNLAELLNRVAYGDARIVLGRRGREIAALVPISDLQLLRQLLATATASDRDRPTASLES